MPELLRSLGLAHLLRGDEMLSVCINLSMRMRNHAQLPLLCKLLVEHVKEDQVLVEQFLRGALWIRARADDASRSACPPPSSLSVVPSGSAAAAYVESVLEFAMEAMAWLLLPSSADLPSAERTHESLSPRPSPAPPLRRPVISHAAASPAAHLPSQKGAPGGAGGGGTSKTASAGTANPTSPLLRLPPYLSNLWQALGKDERGARSGMSVRWSLTTSSAGFFVASLFAEHAQNHGSAAREWASWALGFEYVPLQWQDRSRRIGRLFEPEDRDRAKRFFQLISNAKDPTRRTQLYAHGILVAAVRGSRLSGLPLPSPPKAELNVQGYRSVPVTMRDEDVCPNDDLLVAHLASLLSHYAELPPFTSQKLESSCRVFPSSVACGATKKRPEISWNVPYLLLAAESGLEAAVSRAARIEIASAMETLPDWPAFSAKLEELLQNAPSAFLVVQPARGKRAAGGATLTSPRSSPAKKKAKSAEDSNEDGDEDGSSKDELQPPKKSKGDPDSRGDRGASIRGTSGTSPSGGGGGGSSSSSSGAKPLSANDCSRLVQRLRELGRSYLLDNAGHAGPYTAQLLSDFAVSDELGHDVNRLVAAFQRKQLVGMKSGHPVPGFSTHLSVVDGRVYAAFSEGKPPALAPSMEPPSYAMTYPSGHCTEDGTGHSVIFSIVDCGFFSNISHLTTEYACPRHYVMKRKLTLRSPHKRRPLLLVDDIINVAFALYFLPWSVDKLLGLPMEEVQQQLRGIGMEQSGPGPSGSPETADEDQWQFSLFDAFSLVLSPRTVTRLFKTLRLGVEDIVEIGQHVVDTELSELPRQWIEWVWPQRQVDLSKNASRWSVRNLYHRSPRQLQ
ncbi:MAG: hypothetical protein JSR69_21465 [Proteobacteria bacterium]|nr:hypothetical protein [Pseudomonadota bacterium]